MGLLEPSIFNEDTLIIARALLGTKLVHQWSNQVLSGMIVETEAYLGETDSASHAFRGPTARNKVMFGEPGQAYVYLIYGLHKMFNVVTEPLGTAGAILVRAMEPIDGRTQMEKLRGCQGKGLTNGPGKICQALSIDLNFNGWNLKRGKTLWLEDHQTISEAKIAVGPRVRIGYATPEAQNAPWRFWIAGHDCLSK